MSRSVATNLALVDAIQSERREFAATRRLARTQDGDVRGVLHDARRRSTRRSWSPFAVFTSHHPAAA
jgi:hypothetical protein